MPDPITSSSSSAGSSCSFDDDPSLACQGAPAASPTTTLNACLPPEAPLEPTSSSAASALAQKFPRNAQPAFVAASPASGASTTGPGVLSVRPDQVDLQGGIPRILAQAALGGAQLTASVDILNANAHLGSLNEDGSHGQNIGAGATLLGGALNIDYKGWSLTLGVAASLGGSISSGEARDIDGDGVRERCFAMSLGPFTLGECDEL